MRSLVRFHFWLFMANLTTFYLQLPWRFLTGLVFSPVFFLVTVLLPEEEGIRIVSEGIDRLEGNWQRGIVPRPPGIVQEALKQVRLELDLL